MLTWCLMGAGRVKWGTSIVTQMWTQTWLIFTCIWVLSVWKGDQVPDERWIWELFAPLYQWWGPCWVDYRAVPADGKIHNQDWTLPPGPVRECLVSWGNQLGFRAEKKPSRKSKAGVSLKFREMLEIAFLVERGRELSGRRSNGPRKWDHKSHKELIRQREWAVGMLMWSHGDLHGNIQRSPRKTIKPESSM